MKRSSIATWRKPRSFRNLVLATLQERDVWDSRRVHGIYRQQRLERNGGRAHVNRASCRANGERGTYVKRQFLHGYHSPQDA